MIKELGVKNSFGTPVFAPFSISRSRLFYDLARVERSCCKHLEWIIAMISRESRVIYPASGVIISFLRNLATWHLFSQQVLCMLEFFVPGTLRNSTEFDETLRAGLPGVLVKVPSSAAVKGGRRRRFRPIDLGDLLYDFQVFFHTIRPPRTRQIISKSLTQIQTVSRPAGFLNHSHRRPCRLHHRDKCKSQPLTQGEQARPDFVAQFRYDRQAARLAQVFDEETTNGR